MSLKQTPDIHYKNLLKIKLNNSTSTVINGSITGRTYIFRSKGDLNWVDKRDLNDFEKNMNFSILA